MFIPSRAHRFFEHSNFWPKIPSLDCTKAAAIFQNLLRSKNAAQLHTTPKRTASKPNTLGGQLMMRLGLKNLHAALRSSGLMLCPIRNGSSTQDDKVSA